MSNPNPLNLPEEILGILNQSHTVEYASLTQAGVPITFPISPYVGEDGCTLDVQTGLAYPAKAERARRHPRVCLLYSEPLGTGLKKPPVVLVYGQATVQDADLQANTDRYLKVSLERYPEAYGRMPGFFLKTMRWYFARIWIKVTPRRILWWPAGDLSQAPKTWQARESVQAPPSDPPPSGKPLGRWDSPPIEWHSGAEYAIRALGKPVLTVVDEERYPVPMRVKEVCLNENGFNLKLWPASPTLHQGKANLMFHKHDEKMSWQENIAFVGEIHGAAREAHFKVHRRLSSVSYKDESQIRTMRYMLGLRSKFLPRLRHEAERRGQPVPEIRA